MNLSDYAQCDGVGLTKLIRDRQVSAAEVCEAAVAAHGQINPRINAVIEMWDGDFDALSRSDGPFAGVPFLIKDVALQMEGKKS